MSGAALARQGRWDAALRAFERSSSLVAHPVTTYNIGYCERALGHPTRARRAFRLAIRNGAETELDPEVFLDLKRYLGEAETQVARIRVRLRAPAVALAVDGRPLIVDTPGVLLAGVRDPGDPERVPSSFELEVDPGRHVFVVSDLAGRSHLETRELAPGSTTSLTLALPPLPKRRLTTAPPSPAAERERWVAIGLAGVGAVSLGVGGYLAWRAKSVHDEAVEACPARTSCPDNRGNERSLDARRLGNLATVALVTGISALGGATVMYVDSRERDGARSVLVSGSFE